MIFQHVEIEHQKAVDATTEDCGTIQAYCGFLFEELSKFYASPNSRANHAVEFTVGKGNKCLIDTPYGQARGGLDIHLIDDAISGRVVFEKQVTNEDGVGIWVQVWAIRIDRFGRVLLGDEGNIEVAVANLPPHRNGIGSVAKSLLHRIASKPTFGK